MDVINDIKILKIKSVVASTGINWTGVLVSVAYTLYAPATELSVACTLVRLG
jgi:hypothetical protein